MPALPPLATTFSSERPRFFRLQTLSTSLNHVTPSVPVPRAATMRAVQTSGSTQAQRARIPPTCGPLSGTVVGVCSCVLSFTLPPSCLPLLHGRYPVSALLRRLCHLSGAVLRTLCRS